MGKLIEGNWVKKSVITSDQEGNYDREERSFRDQIKPDHSKFKPEKNRYHLYVSYACPWAHRTLIFRKLKKLENIISVNVVHPEMLDHGWEFREDFKGSTRDELYHSKYLYQIYQKADSKINTTVTVPILWDKKNETVVNNESSEIIRIFNGAFNELTKDFSDFYPKAYQDKIDEINERVYHQVNNGVYKAGFAKTQESYDQAVKSLFETLDFLEDHLNGNDYLVGNQLTEADIRLVVTLLRFDLVYFTHFKCNLKRILDYKNLSKYLKNLFEMNEIKSTTHFDHIKRHYYYSHPDINPYQIIPIGPDIII
jgi:putative glutathione S-transferase